MSKPTTIKGVAEDIVAKLSEQDRMHIIARQPINPFAGMNIRNHYDLWIPNSPVRQDAIEHYSIAHADDISWVAMEWAWAMVRGETFDPMTIVEKCHAHWRAQDNVTSLKAGLLKGEG